MTHKSIETKSSEITEPRFIESKYLSALTDREIFERVLKNSKVAEKNKEILGYLSLKKENTEDRVFGENQKAWEWKYDYSRDEFKIPDSGMPFYFSFKKKAINI